MFVFSFNHFSMFVLINMHYVHIWGYNIKNDHAATTQTYTYSHNNVYNVKTETVYSVKCDWLRSFKISNLFKIKSTVVHSVSKNISNKIKMVSTYQSWSVFEQFGASFFLQEWFISLDSIKWLHDIVIFIVFGWEHAAQSFRIDRESSV